MVRHKFVSMGFSSQLRTPHLVRSWEVLFLHFFCYPLVATSIFSKLSLLVVLSIYVPTILNFILFHSLYIPLFHQIISWFILCLYSFSFISTDPRIGLNIPLSSILWSSTSLCHAKSLGGRIIVSYILVVTFVPSNVFFNKFYLHGELNSL